MFSLIRYAPSFQPGHKADVQIQVQGQIPNPMSLDDARRLALELRGALGVEFPESQALKLELAKVKADFSSFANKADAKVGTLNAEIARLKALPSADDLDADAQDKATAAATAASA